MKKRTTIRTVTIALFVGMVFSMSSGVAKEPSVKKTSFSNGELRTFAEAVPSVKNARQLYSVAMAISNNVEQRQMYLRIAAACLIACDKKGVYEKHIEGKLFDAAEFEKEVKDDCGRCAGIGTKERRCVVCKGGGKCVACKGSGEIVRSSYATGSFTRRYELRPCGKCDKRGTCYKCDGMGSRKEKCLTCAGTGNVFSTTAAARFFRDACNAIVDGRVAEAKAKAEAEERERERKVAEAEAKAEAEERERERKVAEEKARIERENMEALGLVNVYGKWMTPGSLRDVRYRIIQIYRSGHALCTDGNRVFCLLFSSNANRNAAEGDIYVNDLYRCGTYSYTTINNAPSTVAKFAIDIETALRENAGK